MDILDIDEVLKDDSFIFLEDKTHDDISNILQQWKSNSCLLPSITAAQQQQHEQGVNKVDIRKFSMSKRKSVQNLDTQFAHILMPHENVITNANHPMLNLQIGGLVTTLEKSYLQDTSPPSLLCSMDNSVNSMSNSLVTSADFTNISFLQSPNSLHIGGNEGGVPGNNSDGDHILNEMLRGRKTLDALFISNDGTFIKDSHIGQIDDISLALSKTASSCSTIENSTGSDDDYADADEKEQNSDGDINRTVIMCNNDHTFSKNNHDIIYDNIENTFITNDSNKHPKETTEQPLNKTLPISTNHNNDYQQQQIINTNELEKVNNGIGNYNAEDIEMNKTYDYVNVNNLTPNDILSPVDNNDKSQLRRFCESTPQASNGRHSKHHYASKLHAIIDTDISPIMSPLLSQSKFNATYEQLQLQQQPQQQHNATYTFNSSNNGTFNDHKSPQNPNKNINGSNNSNKEVDNNTEEMAAIENSNLQKQKLSETYSAFSMTNTIQITQNQNDAAIEANLLAASNNEEEFDHILDKFGKIQLNSEQIIKMKKSLDTLKKRFNYNAKINSTNTSLPKNASTMLGDVEEGDKLTNSKESVIRDSLETQSHVKSFNDQQNFYKEHNSITQMQNNDSNKNSSSNSPIQQTNGCTMQSGNTTINGNTSGERLLSRRSRLYDDINLAALSPSSSHAVTTATAVTVQGVKCSSSTSPLSTSFVINNKEQKHEQEQTVESPIADKLLDRNNTNGNKILSIHNKNKALEKLQHDRDRDRFKTIVICKNRSKSVHDQNDYNYEVSLNKDRQSIVNKFNNVPCGSDSTAATTNVVHASKNNDVEISEKPDEISNVELDPERFKTIKITNKKRFPQKSLFSVPFIDNNANNQCNKDNGKPLAGESLLTERYSRRDLIENSSSKNVNKNTTSQINKNFFTYKKNKLLNADDGATTTVLQNEEDLANIKSTIMTKATNITKYNVRPEARALSRPRFISGLTKLSAVGKATSADELQKTTLSNTNRNCNQINATRDYPSSNAYAHAGTSTLTHNNNVKSPMGIKSKSFHNLSSNLTMSRNVTSNASNTVTTTTIGSGIRRIEQEKKLSSKYKPNGISVGDDISGLMKTALPGSSLKSGVQQQKSDDAIFKIPKQVSGIRAPSVGGEKIARSVTATAGKRAGLLRPSSGYYNLNAINKGLKQYQQQSQEQQSVINATESNIGRQSSTESMSSLSSKGSTNSLTTTQFGLKQSSGNNHTATSTMGINPVKMQTNLNLQQITIAASGIPKPSGLRPPSNTKHRSSGLPRPASYVKSDK